MVNGKAARYYGKARYLIPEPLYENDGDIEDVMLQEDIRELYLSRRGLNNVMAQPLKA